MCLQPSFCDCGVPERPFRQSAKTPQIPISKWPDAALLLLPLAFIWNFSFADGSRYHSLDGLRSFFQMVIYAGQLYTLRPRLFKTNSDALVLEQPAIAHLRP